MSKFLLKKLDKKGNMNSFVKSQLSLSREYE